MLANSKKSLAVLLLVCALTVSFVLGGCAKTNETTDGSTTAKVEETTKAQSEAASETKELVAVMWGEQARWDAQKKVNDGFTKEFPNLTIDLQVIANADYWTKVETMIAGGIPPDIAFQSEMLTPTYQAKGIMAELDPFMEKDTSFKKDCMPAGMYGPFTVGGKLYAMPTMTFVNLLFYNKTLFDAAGVPYPDENYTWDKAREDGKKLTKDTNGDGKVDQYGYMFAAWPNFFYPYLWANGGDIVKEDRKTAVLNSPENVQTVQFLHDLIWVDKVCPTAAANKNNTFDFQAGNVAMFDIGSWGVTIYDDKKLNFGVTLSPMAPNGKRAVNEFPNGWFIVKQSKSQEDAWKYLAYNVSEEGQKVMAESKVGMPVNTNILDSDLYLKSSTADLSVTLKAAEMARPAYTSSNWAEIEKKIWPEFDNIWTKEKADVKAVLDDMQTKLQETLNEAK